MEFDRAAYEAAKRAWVDGQPPISPAALERIRPVWLPAYRAAAEDLAHTNANADQAA